MQTGPWRPWTALKTQPHNFSLFVGTNRSKWKRKTIIKFSKSIAEPVEWEIHTLVEGALRNLKSTLPPFAAIFL